MKTDAISEENYTKEVVKISLLRANIFAIMVLAAAVAAFGTPYYLLWHEKYHNTTPFFSILRNDIIASLIWLVLLLAGIVAHELIHGMFFALYAKNGCKSVKLGIMPASKLYTPYAHCREPLKMRHYRTALIMPTIVLGIIPAVVALCVGNLSVFIFGMIFIAGGAGDILIMVKSIKERSSTMILDHPTECGFYVYRKIS